MKVRYVVHWTADDGTASSEVCAGRGAFGKAQGMRHRLDQHGAHIRKEQLDRSGNWLDFGIIPEHIAAYARRRK